MPIPEDVVRVSIQHGIDGVTETFVNTLHLKRNHDQGNTTNWPADVQEIATKVAEKYTPAGRPLSQLPQLVKLKKVSAYHLRATQGALPHEKPGTALHVGEWVGAAAGALAEPPLPFDVCAVLTLIAKPAGVVLANPRSGPNPSRQHRGRMSIGPLPENTLERNATGTRPGRFTLVKRDALLTAWGLFLNDLEGMTVGGGVAPDKMQVGVLSMAGGAFHRLTSIRMDDLPDTQRRRSADMVGLQNSVAITQD